MFLNNALSFLFPTKCIFCGKYGEIICDTCIKRIEKYENIKVIKKCDNLDSLISFFKYEKSLRKWLLRFKFNNKPVFAKVFAKIILKNEKICGNLKFYDIIISVPMQKNKKLIRGYNQTELFAEQIANSLKVTYNKCALVKVRDNKMQSSLKEAERKQNVQGAFEIIDSSVIKNKNIILIDDIYTTGSTLEECAKVLKEAGAKHVLGLVIAKD